MVTPQRPTGDRISIHSMVPGDKTYWKEEVRKFLLMSPEEQLGSWRQKRAAMRAGGAFDEYGEWMFYLQLATKKTEVQLIPVAIWQEEMSVHSHGGDDGTGMGLELEQY